MSGPVLAPNFFVALVAATLVAPVAAPASARAQDAIAAPCQLCADKGKGEGDAPSATPLRLEVQTRLDFDKVVFGGTGEARVELAPDGTSRWSGAASATGARALPGTVLIRGEPGRSVRVDLPRTVTLFGEGSSGIHIDSLVTDLPSFPRIGDDGTLSFRFGGDLRISGDNDGTYRGAVDIIVEYL